MKRLRQRLQPSRTEAVTGTPRLPSLPKPRPRHLTPTPCSSAATSQSSLFRRIPPEIRRAILIAAFGQRTLHLDLKPEHPPRRRRIFSSRKADEEPPRHANAQLFSPRLRDPGLWREWAWWGCVCHRCPPEWNFRLRPPGTAPLREEPVNDRCRCDGGAPVSGCALYPGTLPQKCFVGALSWLLTCRQAYIEGVDVLYATNRLHMAHAGIVTNLARFLVPSRLSVIREVELLWSLAIDAMRTDRLWTYDADEFSFNGVSDGFETLAHIPLVLPNLQYLHLSFTDGAHVWRPRTPGRSVPERSEVARATERALTSIDAMVLQLPQLRQCRIALPTSMYSTAKLSEKGEDITWNGADDPEPEAMWRTLKPTAASAPQGAERRHIEGYWIVLGQVDFQLLPPSPDTH